jgi:hypothetical protein
MCLDAASRERMQGIFGQLQSVHPFFRGNVKCECRLTARCLRHGKRSVISLSPRDHRLRLDLNAIPVRREQAKVVPKGAMARVSVS